MLDRPRIEEGHHQVDVVVRSLHVERRAGLRDILRVYAYAVADFIADQRFIAGTDFLLYGRAEKAATDRPAAPDR